MFACCHSGSSIDAAGACGNDRYRSHIAASANYKSGRHIASAMGNYAGQAPVAELSTLSRSQLEARATSLCVAHRNSKRRKTRRQLQEDCRLALEAQHSAVQQEARCSRKGALDVGGSTFAGASSLSAAPTCGQDAERTKTVPGYASDRMHTASTTTNFDAQGLAVGDNALGSAVAELSQLNQAELRARATSLGVARRSVRKKQKTRRRLKHECRLALEAQQSEGQLGCAFLRRTRVSSF